MLQRFLGDSRAIKAEVAAAVLIASKLEEGRAVFKVKRSKR